MFSNIISSLTSLLPKSFIFSAYVPVLIFGFLNGLLLYEHHAAFRSFVNEQIKSPLTLTTSVLFVASIVAAYVLSSVSDFLRDLLEGKHLPPGLEAMLRTRQYHILQKLDRNYEDARTIAAHCDRNQVRIWQEEVSKAASAGAKAAADSAQAAEPPKGGASGGIPSGERTKAVDKLRTGLGNILRQAYRGKDRTGRAQFRLLRYKVSRNLPFSFDDVQNAVAGMCDALSTFDITSDKTLEADRDDLLNIIDYARIAADDRELQAFTNRQTRFGTVAEPTIMGNVGASIASYTTTRYGIDLDTFWSRVQCIMQKNPDKAYDALIDAKTQLNFLTTCCFLTALTTGVWFVVLGLFGTSLTTFLLVALAGPALSTGLYRLAVTNYLAYGQVIRANVDLNRFSLLESLHIRRPSGIREERELWKGLRELSSFGSEGIDLSYEAPKS
jgi:hypothetical protein